MIMDFELPELVINWQCVGSQNELMYAIEEATGDEEFSGRLSEMYAPMVAPSETEIIDGHWVKVRCEAIMMIAMFTMTKIASMREKTDSLEETTIIASMKTLADMIEHNMLKCVDRQWYLRLVRNVERMPKSPYE
jgi:hypothetical protein